MTHQEIVNRRLALYSQIDEGRKAAFDAKRPEIEQNIAACASIGHVYDEVTPAVSIQLEREFLGRRRCVVCHGFEVAREPDVVAQSRG